MARRGEVLESPINGQRAIFRETVEDTGGELLSLDFFVAPAGFWAASTSIPSRRNALRFSLARCAAAKAVASAA